MSDYWRDELPPVRWGGTLPLPDGTLQPIDFGTADGHERIVAFWREGKRYFCCRTNVVHEG